MTFQLDTSGAVHGVIASDGDLCAYLWDDLSPFVQGYVEAVFNEHGPGWIQGDDHDGLYWVPRFSDLAPETLARIIADCERWQGLYPKGRLGHEGGARFWELRQAQYVERSDFPPLTVQPGDDGKVRCA